MMDRRDLLKFFGAGAIIAPMVDGKVMREAEALIVEPPKVEIVKELPRQMSPQGLVNAFVDRKSTRLNSSHIQKSRMPSSA